MNTRLFRSALMVLAAVLAVVAVACSGSDSKSTPTVASTAAAGTSPAATAKPALSGKITVFAAASLTDAFNDIKTAFIKQNPGTDIEFQFAGSPALRTQLEQGAKADVYASADVANMTMALQSGVVHDVGKVFVKNSLVIITPKNNPAGIAAPVDLKKSGLKLVVAAPEVPVGNYARQAFALMDKDPAYGAGFADAVLKNVVSNESNVKQVVAKVQLGEADAGIVYGTDVTKDVAPDLKQIAIPASVNVIAEYPIALTKTPGNAAVAQAFIDFVLGPDGQAILKQYGFVTS